MSLNAATIEMLIAKGMCADDILDVARATEIKADPTNAQRQARFRAKRKAAENNTVTVTEDSSPYEDTSTPSGTDISDEASASSPLRQPLTQARDIWNENAAQAGWGTITTLSATRSKALGSRLREHGLEGWRAGIARARASPYLGGADPPSWFKFDWLIKPGNFLKLIEGNYDRNRSDKPVSSWGSARDSVRLHPQ